MNVMTTEILEESADHTADASAQKRDVALARLMKAWESKNARAAKRAGGLSLVAVTLAACNGSSDGGSSTDNGDGGDGGEGGDVTPVPDGGTFVVDNFPQTEEAFLGFATKDGGFASASDVIDLLNGALAAIDTGQAGDAGGDITTGDIQVIIDTLDDNDGNGSPVVNIGGGEGQTNVDQLLTLLNSDLLAGGELLQVNQVEIGRVVLTPGDASDTIVPEGSTPGDGNDTILMGRTELLHGAFIDAGDGSDTLEITAKGPYAQPLAVLNVETVDITNQPNLSLSTLPDDINTTDIVSGAVTSTTFPLFDENVLDDFTTENDTWIDLGTARDVETVKISESGNNGFGGGFGNLFVIGINNDATLELAGGFSNDVNVDFGFNTEATSVVLNNVNFADFNSLRVAQNSTALSLESTGGATAVENFINNGLFGPNLRELTITGDVSLNIATNVVFNTNSATTINAGVNTGGVKLTTSNSFGDSIANNTINVVGSQGDDDFTLAADAFDITSGAGENAFNLTGTYDADLPNGQINGMRLVFDGSAGSDTITLNGDQAEQNGELGEVLGLVINEMLSGSSITGTDNSLVVNDSYSLTEATLEGITSVAIAPSAALAVTGDQVSALGADVFSVVDADAFVAAPGSVGPTVAIVLESGDDVTLSDLIDPTALDSNVKLGFRIPENAKLTLTAEELHTYVANPGILMDNNDGNQLESVGELIITDAGENFNPFFTGAVDEPGLGLQPGGGAIIGPNNVTVERSEGGFERPSQEPIDDTFLIDSSDGPIEFGPNDFGEDDEFTLPLETTTLLMQGENDITLSAPVSFGITEDFTIDFSEVEGVVTGLEIVDFQNITAATDPITGDPDPDNWGQVIGNGDARVDVQLDGNVGNNNNGLISSGVATYVVTDITGDGDGAGGILGPNAQFWTSDPTEDLEVLGLQGNAGNTITFGNVRNGVNFLMEGDGFASFEDVPKALEPLDESNIGSLVANFNAGSGTVSAVVDINNQGVELGAASDGGEREFYVDGIEINGAQTITVNVADGDADIGGIPVNNSGVVGDALETLIINSADDVNLTVDAFTSDLETLDASGVDGTMTLEVLATNGPVDLSETTLIGVEAVEMQQNSALALTSEQFDDIGAGNVSILDDGDPLTAPNATLTIAVTDDTFDVSTIDPSVLPEGLDVQLRIEPDVTLTMTADQFATLSEAGVTFIDGATPPDEEPGSINLTGFDGDNVTLDPDTGAALIDYSIVPPTIAGTITFDGPLDLAIPQVYAGDLGNFDYALEGGTIGLESAAMANGLVVDNGNVDFLFTHYGGETAGVPPVPGVDASGYTNITKVTVGENFSDVFPGTEFNVESIANLPEGTDVEVAPLNINILGGVNQVAFVGGVPIDNPGGTPAPVVEPTLDLLFDNITGDPEQNVQTVDLFFEVGGNEINDITIGTGAAAAAPGDVKPLFDVLAITSDGNAVNTVGNIGAIGNNLLDVEIVANQEFEAQTITLESEEPGADATVTVSGSANVTLKAIDSSDGDIDTVTVDTTGYTGTLTLTAGSDAAEMDATETLVFTGDGDVVLDTSDTGGEDGVDGGGDLTGIDASGQTGSLDLSVVKNVAEGFTLTGGTGRITGEIDALPADDWSLDISDAASGSAITVGDEVLTAGSLSLETDPDSTPSDETTLTFGDNTVLEVGTLFGDLSVFDNVVFGADVELVLSEDGLIRMDDDTFADFDAAGGTIVGETAKTFDAGIDLQDVRGLDEVNIEQGSTGTFTLTSEQLAVARIVDTDGNPVSDFGDIEALKAEPSFDLALAVKDGDTLALSDNDANGLDITGDGAVEVTMEGTKGAELTVADGDNNDPGQSVVVNYTLGGDAGSVTVDNNAIDFQDASAVASALEAELNGEEGLTASSTFGTVTFGAEEAGEEFILGDVTVTDGGSGFDVTGESTVTSDADMTGNEVEATTHIFPTISSGFYVLDGTVLGGASNEDDELTVTLNAEGGNFIDAQALAGIPGGATAEDTTIALVGAPKVKFADGFLDGEAVTGDGSVQVENPTSAFNNFSTVDVPVEAALTVSTSFTGSFNPGQTLEITDTDPDTEFGLDITGATGLPASITLTGTQVTLTADQANGLTIDGGSTAVVELDPDGNEDLSDISVDLVLDGAGGGSEFGGTLPASDVRITGDVTLKPGAGLPAGTSFSVGVSQTLTLTAAQADGLSVTPLLDDEDDVISTGEVTITDPTGAEDLSGIDIPLTLDITDDEATTLTLAASELAGNDVSVTGGDPGETFTLTVSGLEGAPGADLSGVSVSAGDAFPEVDVELDSTGGVEIAENADFGIAADGDLTLEISGDGEVTVASSTGNDPDLSGIESYDVGADATLVKDEAISGSDAIDRSLVEGDGTLVRTGFEVGDSLDAGDTDVALQVFEFGNDDFQGSGATGRVEIGFGAPGTQFENGGAGDPTDALDLNAILEVQGAASESGFGDFGTGNEDQVLILDPDTDFVNNPQNVVTAFDGAAAGSTEIGANGSENFLVVFDEGENLTSVWHWQDGVDTGGGTDVASDGIVGESELTQVANLLTEDDAALSADNFVV